ncbi:MAG: 16S rRNA (guanine(527)-N(7))-methyltransferase RsmG [Acidiferrobacterales bacterium]
MQGAAQLAAGLRELSVELSADVQARSLEYLTLLTKWNRVYNLTAVRDPCEMVARHLLDSLAAAPFIKGPRVLDIGTGAGLPGIPLALALPDARFVLLDRSAKKARFVRQVVAELMLRNVEVVCARVQDFAPANKFDTLVTRALASINELLAMAGHLCARDGRILFMKGADPAAELVAIPRGYKLNEVKRLQVPATEAERHLVWVSPSA